MAGATKSARKGMISKKQKQEEEKGIVMQLKNPKNLRYKEKSILFCTLSLGGSKHGELVYCQYRGNDRITKIAKEHKSKDVVLEVIKVVGECI